MPAKKKTTRAPRGDGSIFPDRRRGGWIAKVPVGRDPDTGKLLYERVRAKTQDAVRKLRDAAKPVAVGPTMTVAQWSKKWLESLTQKPQTRDEYERQMRLRIIPRLGASSLTAITTFAVEAAAKVWATECAAGTVRKTMSALSGCLQAAHRADLVARNPVRAARRPAATGQKFDLFTPAEVRAIIDLALTKATWRAFALLAGTGCRIGEALALDPADYDAETGLLTISRTRTRQHGRGTPKSRNSLRTIRVPLAARPALVAGIPTADYTVQRQRWHAVLKRLAIRDRGMHQLRHTLASAWHAANVPAAEIAKYLGDSVETVTRVYCHATGSVDPSAVTDSLLETAVRLR